MKTIEAIRTEDLPNVGENLIYSDQKRLKLSKELELKLVRRMRAGDTKARAILVKSLIGRVHVWAAKYRRPGVDYSDLVQDGIAGCLEGLDKYNENTGTRLVTYVEWWIRRNIAAQVPKAYLKTTVPRAVYEKRRKLPYVVQKLTHEYDREPTEWEVAQTLGVTPEEYASLKQVIDFSDDSNDDDRDDADVMPDHGDNPETIALRNHCRETVAKAMANLTDAERKVITQRFGLDGEDALDPPTIRENLGISASTLRSTMARAYRKLRYELKDYAA